MKLSVITSVYNEENHIRESLDSIFNQTFTDFELIVVNDGSTDGTRDILITYMDKYPNMRLLENKYNEGIPVSRNRALLEAKGEYIAIHDGDDISLPDRLLTEVQFMEWNKNVVVVGSHAIKISATGQKTGLMSYPPPSTQKAYSMILKMKFNPIIDPSCMYRRQTILEFGGYPMEPEWITVPDFHLWCRLISSNLRIANIQKPLIKYRINPKGVTRTRQKEMILATDQVWASFKKRNLKRMKLRADYFMQDSFIEYQNN